MKTSDGVQDKSNFTISFDPDYQSVKIHNLDLIREGKRLNRLDLSEFDIYRTETDRDKLLYNGTLQTALIIPDVRVGDILDYSYTILGKNPALGPHYTTYTSLKYSVPIQRTHERILIHNNLSVYEKIHNGARPPIVSQQGNFRVYKWAADELKKRDVDDNTPDWYYSYPQYNFSSYKDWAEVGEYFATKYKPRYSTAGPISEIAEKIKKRTDKVKERRRFALDFVQKNIRYTGVELGSGGYIPRPPEEVLETKYGDCKDMTILLLAILQELDIKAHAVLVDNELRNGIAGMIPTHNAFDHVLVRSVVQGKSYYMDGTRGEQLGDLDRMEQGNYGKGLLLAQGKAELIDMEGGGPEFYKDIVDTFDLLPDSEAIMLKSVSTYYGYQADTMHSLLVNDGLEKIEKNFLGFFQDTYPNIEQIGDITAESFQNEAKFVVSASYKMPSGWESDLENNRETFEAYPSDVTDSVVDFKGGSRTMPYALSHPQRSRHKIVMKLDQTWDLNADSFTEDNSAFNFKKAPTFTNGTYTQTYIYKTKQDHIGAKNFESIMTRVKVIEDELGVELYRPTGALALLSEENVLIGIGSWMIIAGLVSIIGAAIRMNVDAAWQENQMFYPVKLSKFILLSVVSFGIYQYFWAYKNWRWLRDVGNEHNTPFLRAFFMNFTNFVLLPQLESEGKQGYAWYNPYMGGLLAFAFFAFNIIGRIGDRIEEAPIWVSVFGLISFVILIPAAMQILKLNEGNEEVIAKNSTYHWTTVGFIILFSPIFLLVLYGLFP